MQASEIKFRASQTGRLMTEPRSRSETISETTKDYLLEVYIAYKYGRWKDITSKYMEKGLQVEEDSITLYSRVTGELHFKNEVMLENGYIKGTPDLFSGKLENAKLIVDIKSSWDIFTFFKSKSASINKDYYWQLQSYMWLTNCQKSKLAYCLVNTPQEFIDSEKSRFLFRSSHLSQADIDRGLLAIESNMTFDDIPMAERCHVIDVSRNDEDIIRLQQRVADCRLWMDANLFTT